MIIPINRYKNLYVADFSNSEKMLLKIVFHSSSHFLVDKQLMCPFAEDVETGYSVLVSNSKHIKNLKYYVNCFGFPRKKILEDEREKQQLVVEEVKQLRKLRKI